MAYQWQRWMPDAYRAAGLNVIVVEGWENRGRPASTGDFTPNGAETVHHTGTTTSPSNPRAGLQTLIEGRPDLPGPLAQKATAHDGTVIIIAAGRANHAGRVGKPGVVGMPLGADGNALAMGNEVMTDGTQPLTEAQRRSIAIQAAVDNEHFGRAEEWSHRHEDISGSGKWDLGSLTTAELRADVRRELTARQAPETPEDDMAAEDVWTSKVIPKADTPDPNDRQSAAWALAQARAAAIEARNEARAARAAVEALTKAIEALNKRAGG